MSFNNIEESESTRETGNSFFKTGKYFAALAQYNKALVFAQDDKEHAALCYGNRSAVYLKLEYFQHCLHNIDLAEPHYPADKIQKLHDRRQECLQMMKTKPEKAMKPFDYASKLSYEPNPKIPFFIGALELKNDPIHGKHIITTQDLKAGDVIGILDPWRIPINHPKSNYKLACYNCLDMNNGDLIPGNYFNVDFQPLFCSEKCRDEHKELEKDHEGIHKFEELHEYKSDGQPEQNLATNMILVQNVFLEIYDAFECVDKMRIFVNSHRKVNYSFFDFDWSMSRDDPEYKKNMLLVIVRSRSSSDTSDSLLTVMIESQLKSSTCDSRLANIRRIQDIRNRLFIDFVVKNIFRSCMLRMNFHPINSAHCIFAVFCHPALNAFPYTTCDPNVFLHHQNDNGVKKIVMTVNQPILAGEKITIPIAGFYYRNQNCNTRNECISCRENWASVLDVEELNDDMNNHISAFYKCNNPKKATSVLKHRNDLCNFINKKFKKITTRIQRFVR